jgi:hypothetical protein
VRFVRFGANQTRETTLRLLAECFEELGGVPAVVMTDRMGCLKAGVVANVVVPHPDYVAFARRYGFTIDFCEAADPESKGMVENLCGCIQTDLLIPALLEPEWPTLEVGNAAARAWCLITGPARGGPHPHIRTARRLLPKAKHLHQARTSTWPKIDDLHLATSRDFQLAVDRWRRGSRILVVCTRCNSASQAGVTWTARPGCLRGAKPASPSA